MPLPPAGDGGQWAADANGRGGLHSNRAEADRAKTGLGVSAVVSKQLVDVECASEAVDGCLEKVPEHSLTSRCPGP